MKKYIERKVINEKIYRKKIKKGTKDRRKERKKEGTKDRRERKK
mgnify:CR=1 FL=1